MKRFVWSVVSLWLLTCLVGPAWAAADDDEVPGLAVGSKAPDFTLPDQSGQDRQLTKLLESGPVALVFYRSADW